MIEWNGFNFVEKVRVWESFFWCWISKEYSNKRKFYDIFVLFLKVTVEAELSRLFNQTFDKVWITSLGYVTIGSRFMRQYI